MNKLCKQISTNRSFIMGVACLWIIFQHGHFNTEVYLLWAIGRFGFTQVDVFVLVSGFGIHYSLNRDNDCIAFYRKRFTRVYPAYLVFGLAYVVFEGFSGNIGIYDSLGVLTATSYVQSGKHVFSWYGQTILVFYLFAPLFFIIISRIKNNPGKMLIFLGASITLSILFMRGNLMMAVSRLPSFLIGMMIAANDHGGYLDKKSFQRISIISSFVCICVIALIEFYGTDVFAGYSVIFLPLFLLPLGECIILSKIAEFMRKRSFLNRIIVALESLGKITLEVYFAQTLFNIIADPMMKEVDSKGMQNCIKVLVVILGVFVAFAVNKVLQNAISKLKTKEVK